MSSTRIIIPNPGKVLELMVLDQSVRQLIVNTLEQASVRGHLDVGLQNRLQNYGAAVTVAHIHEAEPNPSEEVE